MTAWVCKRPVVEARKYSCSWIRDHLGEVRKQCVSKRNSREAIPKLQLVKRKGRVKHPASGDLLYNRRIRHSVGLRAVQVRHQWVDLLRWYCCPLRYSCTSPSVNLVTGDRSTHLVPLRRLSLLPHVEHMALRVSDMHEVMLDL